VARRYLSADGFLLGSPKIGRRYDGIHLQGEVKGRTGIRQLMDTCALPACPCSDNI